MSPLSSYSITFMQQSFLYPLRIHLSAKQKKVAVIALAIFSFIAACSFLYHFCFKAKKDLPIKGNIFPKEVIKLNGSPIAPLKKADDAIKNQDFPDQVKDGKNEVGDQNLEIEGAEIKDLLPEVVEQNKFYPSSPTPPEESNPLNNEIIEKTTIESLPDEVLTMIFELLPISDRPKRVCRFWKEVFDELKPIKLLQSGQFFKVLKEHPLSYYTKDQNEFLRLRGAIQGNSSTPWMDKWIQQCGSEEEEACLFQNLWLTPFSIKENVSYPKIQKIMDLLKRKNIAIFFPRLHLLDLIESLSDEEIESIKEPIKEAIRLKFIKVNTLENREDLQSLQKLLKNPEILLCALQKRGKALKYVPEEKRTAELCLLALQNDGRALKYVPEEKRTAELCLLAVQNDGRALQYVPEEKRTAELYLAAVQQNSSVLQEVPEEKRTVELYLAAVQQDGYVLNEIPEEKRTTELYLAALKQHGWIFFQKEPSIELCEDILRYVPKEKRSAELYLAAVQQNRYALLYVPRERQTAELYLAAVQKNGYTLEDVPEAKRTAELCLAAVQQNGRALKYVPESKRTAELCLKAVQQNRWAIQDVPEEKRTQEICHAAVKQCGRRSVFQYVPEKIRIPEFYLIANRH